MNCCKSRFIGVLFISLLFLTITSVEADIDISSCIDLQNIQLDLSETYNLLNDIDCSGSATWNGNEGFLPLGTVGSPFTGTLNGNNFKINQLSINRTSDHQAIFAYATGANMNNLTLDACQVAASARDYAAILVAHASNVTFNNVTFQSSLGNTSISNRDYSGFLTASANNCSMTNIDILDDAVNQTAIIATNNVGAIGGELTNTTVSNCDINSINVIGATRTGALAGNSENSDFTNITSNETSVFAVTEDAGGLWGRVNDSNILDVDARDIVVDSGFSTDLNTIGGVIGEAWGASRITNVNAINIRMDTTSGTVDSDNIGGFVGTVYGSFVDDIQLINCHVTDIRLEGTEYIAGFAGTVIGDLTNCSVDDAEIIGSGNYIAGFANYLIDGIRIDQTSVENLTLTGNEFSAGYVSVASEALITNSYVKAANLTFNGDNSAGFAAQSFTLLTIEDCFIDDVTIRGNSTGDIAGFVSDVRGTIFNKCYVENLDYDLSVVSHAAGFIVNMREDASVNNCYVANSTIRGGNNAELGCFIHSLYDQVTGGTVDSSYCSSTLIGDNVDEFLFFKEANSSVNSVYFNSDNNLGTGNNYGAIGLNSNAFKNLDNFVGFDQNIWFNGISYPVLSSVEIDRTDLNNKLLLKFRDLYPYKSKDTLVSHIRIISNLADPNFNLILLNENENFYISNNKLYTKKIFKPNESFKVTIKAINSSFETIENTFKLKVLSKPFDSDIGQILIDDEKDDQALLCLNQIKEFLGLSVNEELTFDNLINFYLHAQDKNNTQSSQYKNLLTCEPLLDNFAQIKKDLNLLNINSRGRLNFKKYRKFINRFQKMMKQQHSSQFINKSSLMFDINGDRRLTKRDWDYYKNYFKVSIGQRKNQRKVNQKITKINFKNKVNRRIETLSDNK